jgi:hypothetical protein
MINPSQSNIAAIASSHHTWPKLDTLQRGLLVLTIACAALSLVPPFRVAGSLALRAVSLLSSCITCADAKAPIDPLSRTMRIVKVSVVILGIVAIAAAAPLFCTVSLIADIALQITEIGKALHEGDLPRAWIHVTILAIDACVLVGLITGSWQLMVGAACVSILTMLTIAIKVAIDGIRVNGNVFKLDGYNAFDAMCYTALAVLGMTTALATAYIPKRMNPYNEYTYDNQGDDPVIIKNQDKFIQRIEPHTKATFSLPNFHISNPLTVIPLETDVRGSTLLHPIGIDIPNPDPKPPLEPQFFHTLPLGTGIKTKDM